MTRDEIEIALKIGLQERTAIVEQSAKSALFLDGVKVPNCQSIRKVNNANDESTVSFGGIIKVNTANSDIDVRVSHDNGGDVSLTTIFCNLNAVYIGDLTL